MIVDVDVIQGSAKSSERYTHAIRSTKSTELPTTFDVWFQVKKDTWHASPFQSFLQFWNVITEVTQDCFVPAIPDIRRYKVFLRLLRQYVPDVGQVPDAGSL